MTINYYLKDPKAKAKTALYVQVNYNGKKLKFYPGESIATEFWNPATSRAESKSIMKEGSKEKRNRFSEQMEFNERLNRIETTITSIFLDYKNRHEHEVPAPALLKSLFDMAIKKGGGKTTFIDYFEDFVERSTNGHRINPRSKKSVHEGSGKNYQTTLNHLKDFSKIWKKKVDFETIDLEFHADFTKYLASAPRVHSANTIGSHIKKIKAVMAEASEKGINTNMGFKSRHFVKQTEDTDHIYLNESELKEMERLDLTSNPKLDRVRDLFLIGAHTGLRWSDFTKLKKSNISDNGEMITITQTKTGKPVVIPVHTVVKSILKKYNGNIPASVSNQKMNDYLKEVGEKQKGLCIEESKSITKGGYKVIQSKQKWELLTSHCARRSFCTNEYKAGTDVILLMAISGHRTQQSFLRYIKVTATEHAEKLQAIWASRNNLRVA